MAGKRISKRKPLGPLKRRKVVPSHRPWVVIGVVFVLAVLGLTIPRQAFPSDTCTVILSPDRSLKNPLLKRNLMSQAENLFESRGYRIKRQDSSPGRLSTQPWALIKTKVQYIGMDRSGKKQKPVNRLDLTVTLSRRGVITHNTTSLYSANSEMPSIVGVIKAFPPCN